MPPSISREEKLSISNLSLIASLVCMGVFHVCNKIALEEKANFNFSGNNINVALNWASIITLLSAFYYMQYLLCKRCTSKGSNAVHETPYFSDNVTMYRDLPTHGQLPSEAISSDDFERETDAMEERRPPPRSRLTLPPEMSPFNVLLYAYGWGLMFFVMLYCSAGVYMQSSNWWALGLLVISIDELVSSNVSKTWAMLIVGFVTISTASVWWGVLSENSSEQNFAEIMVGIIAPVVSPFMLLSLRFNPTVLKFNGIQGLIKIAMPFMVVLASCILVIQSVNYDHTSTHHMRRTIIGNESKIEKSEVEFILTHAPFGNDTNTEQTNFTSYDSLPLSNATSASQIYYAPAKLIAILIAPFAALGVARNLVLVVLENCATEFVIALTICTAVRFGVSREYDIMSAMALAASGLGFIMIVLLRRTK
jgi:hypothetical protein